MTFRPAASGKFDAVRPLRGRRLRSDQLCVGGRYDDVAVGTPVIQTARADELKARVSLRAAVRLRLDVDRAQADDRFRRAQ